MELNKLQKILQEYHNKLEETLKETKTLYEISEAESLLLVHVVSQAIKMGYSAKLTSKILKASAHFVETSGEISLKAVKEIIEN